MSGRVLVVDDEPAVRGSLQRALALDSFSVAAVANGAEALGAAAVTALVALIAGEEPPRETVVPVALVVRGSTGPAPRA